MQTLFFWCVGINVVAHFSYFFSVVEKKVVTESYTAWILSDFFLVRHNQFFDDSGKADGRQIVEVAKKKYIIM